MTHCVWTMLVAVLLQPPATPSASATKPEAGVVGKPIALNGWYLEVVNSEYLVVTHPDIRVAEARLMEAQAALDLAKRKVAVEAFVNKAKYDQAKADLATKTKEFERLDALRKSGAVSDEEHAKVTAELQTAKRQLAFAELFKQAEKEAEEAQKGVELNAVYGANVARWLRSTVVSPPAQAQPLADLLQRKVKFAVKASDADRSVIGVLERSLKEWDFAGAKQIVRYPQLPPKALFEHAPFLQPVEGENSIGVWLLLMLDEFNDLADQLPAHLRGKHQIYVREYGLLFTVAKNAPDNALTLAEFVRQAKK